MIVSFPRLVKDLLAPLPQNDYPVLNTRLFVKFWLGFTLDQSLTSMRDLFKRLNNTGFSVDISTFSKANVQRSQKPFIQIYQKLCQLVKKKSRSCKLKNYLICPIDSTIITLTSKLLWLQGYHQVKLLNSLNLSSGVPEENLINFGYDHDYNYGEEMIDALPPNAVGVMDRGFAGLEYIKQLSKQNKYFVLRISKSWKLEFDPESGLYKVGTGKKSGVYRVINFCDLETKCEFRLVTNLPQEGELAVSDEEVREIYRCRWGIELLWKFLKMHLKLDKLITKNVNGIALQIYATLIAYLILQLIEIPQQWGQKLLDKLRYLQACMCQEISYVHWMTKLTKC
ncbi:MAG TPA: IS4 family transposase [Allocoleopsis sp.]